MIDFSHLDTGRSLLYSETQPLTIYIVSVSREGWGLAWSCQGATSRLPSASKLAEASANPIHPRSLFSGKTNELKASLPGARLEPISFDK